MDDGLESRLEGREYSRAAVVCCEMSRSKERFGARAKMRGDKGGGLSSISLSPFS